MKEKDELAIGLVEGINQKAFKDLEPNLKRLAERLFDDFSLDSRFEAGIVDQTKDVMIEYRGSKRVLRLRSGASETIGMEDIQSFIAYLSGEGISLTSLETILLFHYGDGSLDGSGDKRLKYDQLIPLLSKRIALANEELNQSKDFIYRFLLHSLYKGLEAYGDGECFLYRGTIDFGCAVSREDVYRHVKKRTYGYMYNLHIGPIQFHPCSRNAPSEDNKKRGLAYFRWINFLDDIDYMSSRFRFGNKRLVYSETA